MDSETEMRRYVAAMLASPTPNAAWNEGMLRAQGLLRGWKETGVAALFNRGQIDRAALEALGELLLFLELRRPR